MLLITFLVVSYQQTIKMAGKQMSSFLGSIFEKLLLGLVG